MGIRVLSSDKARAKWRDVIDAAVAGEDIVIERYGKPSVAIISYKDFVALEELLEEVRDGREAQVALEEWRRDPDSFRPWEEVKAEL